MNRDQKAVAIAEIAGKIEESDAIFAVDYRGITVEQVAEALREYEAVGVERAMLQHLAHQDLDMVAVLGDLARELAA